MIVFTRLSKDPGPKGIGAVYVPVGAKGLSFGQKETLMGFRGVPSADIFFDNVQVPAENIIVPAGGFAKLMSVFCLERLGKHCIL